jgi:hypothetical protein
MKPQTHAKLYLREIIDNWKYIDGIIFLVILLMFVGFTDPCDRCIVKQDGLELSCKDAFLKNIGYEDTEYGVQKIDMGKKLEYIINSTNLSLHT